MKKRLKITISGAAGQVAYAFLFRLLTSDFFVTKTEIELCLLDVENALDKLHGVQMELEDCVFPNLQKITCTENLKAAMQDTDIAILIGSIPRKSAAESRSDLLKNNAAIFQQQGLALNEYANRNVKVLVVGNPCNTNCLVAMNNAKNISPCNFYAMTMLDENRARFQLACKANINFSAVKNIIVWGNHSSSMFPDFYNAKISSKPVIEVLPENWLKTEFLQLVRARGAEILKARGYSSGQSAANAILVTLEKIFGKISNSEYFSLGCCANGEYGIDEGIVFSFPCVFQNGGIKIVEGIKHEHAFASEQLNIALEELRIERDMVYQMGFISK